MSAQTLPQMQAKVKLYHHTSGNRELLGFAELVIANSFVIKSISIVKSLHGEDAQPFVSFPSKKGTGDRAEEYFDIAHPITAEAYQRASEQILKAYEKAAGSGLAQ